MRNFLKEFGIRFKIKKKKSKSSNWTLLNYVYQNLKMGLLSLHDKPIFYFMPSTKENIQRCAAQSFRKKGYKATSMRNIAEDAGIKAPSIYNHFKNKDVILEELLIGIAQEFTKGMKVVQASSISSLKKMEKLIELHVRLTVDHTDAIALITSEWIHLEKPALKKYTRLRDKYEKDFKSIIEDGKKKKEFQDVDTDLAVFSILSTLRWLYSWYSKNKSSNPAELKEQMVRCLLDGLKR